MARELKAKTVEGRTRRVPLNKRNRLTLKNTDPNFHYRIVNVVDDRVEQFLEQGYEIDPQSEVGDKQVDVASPLGSAKQISVGGGTKAVVMRIPREFYQEDQAFKQAQIDATEDTMRGDAKRYERGQFDYEKS